MIVGKKTLYKQKSMALKLKQTIPQCALVMVCRLTHKANNHYSTMKICEAAPGKLCNV